MAGKPSALIDSIEQIKPFGHHGALEDIDAAVAFLAGSDDRWISGHHIRVGGGVNLKNQYIDFPPIGIRQIQEPRFNRKKRAVIGFGIPYSS